jgi:DNA-binding NarL/FixJ family response regulator
VKARIRDSPGNRAEGPFTAGWFASNDLHVMIESSPSQAGAPALRLVVAEDHGLMLEAIVHRLSADEGVEIVATVGDGRALVETYTGLLAAGEPPDVVLCDYSMPGLNGIEALRAILDRHPEARVLILSAYDDQALVVAAMAAGAAGYLLKSIAPDELREKVRMAGRGEPVLDARTAGHMVGAVRNRDRSRGPAGLRDQPLSAREIGVLRLVAEGLSNTEIAARLYISAQTVKTHLERICTKLGVSGRAAAVRRGIETGALSRA